MGSCLSSDDVEVLEGDVNFTHFKVLRAIGKGSFGKVCIVKKRDTKELYAMKYISKARIVRKNAVDNVLQEAHMLRDLNHPFLVNLWFSFQDEEDLFLVEDCLLGGDLSWHLEQVGRMDVERVKLYVAEIALALEYLRTKKVIHRDIKPANMLLDSNGHIHLADFNVACYVTSGVPVKSCTGTKPYMAPEVYHPSERGYSYAVDWWSLGVTAFELLKGMRPFQISSSMHSTTEIYNVIVSMSPQMSSRWDDNLQNFIKRLLRIEHRKRISNLEAMRQHPFFTGLDFAKVHNMEMSPSYVPPKNKLNCDPTHELEEIILEPNPLHKKSQRLNTRQTITLNTENSSDSELKELNRLQAGFFTYNRLADDEKIAEEREIHRKISSGTIPEPEPLSPHEGPTLPTIEDSGEEEEVKGHKDLSRSELEKTEDHLKKSPTPKKEEQPSEESPVEVERTAVVTQEQQNSDDQRIVEEVVPSAVGLETANGKETPSEVKQSPVTVNCAATNPLAVAVSSDHVDNVPGEKEGIGNPLEVATVNSTENDSEAQQDCDKAVKHSVSDNTSDQILTPPDEDNAPLLLETAEHFEQEI